MRDCVNDCELIRPLSRRGQPDVLFLIVFHEGNPNGETNVTKDLPGPPLRRKVEESPTVVSTDICDLPRVEVEAMTGRAHRVPVDRLLGRGLRRARRFASPDGLTLP